MKELKYGDVVTIEGIYERRSFFDWLFRKPKKLQKFIVIE